MAFEFNDFLRRPRQSENEKHKSSGNQCLSEVSFGHPVEICVHFVSDGCLIVMELELLFRWWPGNVL